MKVTAASTLLLGALVSAHSQHDRHHAHGLLHLKRGDAPLPAQDNLPCICTTYVTTITGEASLYQPSVTTATSYATIVPVESETSPSAEVPTPVVTVYPLPGTYTIPASTVTLTSPTIVPAPVTTNVSSGEYTFGGVTTVVSTSTTITCPYVSVETVGTVVKSKVYETAYVCPSAGTYTVAPMTTTVSESTIWILPVPTSYAPGTYTQAQTTVTITETSQLVFCPFSTLASSSLTNSSLPASTSPASTSVSSQKSTLAPALSSYVAPASSVVAPSSYVASASSSTKSSSSSTSTIPTSIVASSSSASASPSPSKSSNGGSIGGGEQWCMTYSPYTSGGDCKSQSEVESDIADIAQKGFTSVRLYGTDCNGLTNAGGPIQKYGLKLVAGVFIDNKGVSGAEKQVEDLISWGQWSLVELIVIGNEALFNGYVTASELASLIASSKQKFQLAGYTGPCTTTESTVPLIKEHSDVLCPVLDVVAANIHPFFNPDTTASDAGKFVAQELQALAEVCPGKQEALNLETGWPSSGQANGKAVPGDEEQKQAIEAIKQAVGGKVAFFSYVDDMWKTPGKLGVEQHFGCGHLF